MKEKQLSFLELDMFGVLQLAAIILVTIGIYSAFSSEGISANGYKELTTTAMSLKSLGDLATIKLISVGVLVLSAIIIYLSLTKISEKKTIATLVTLFFLFSPVVSSNLAFFLSFIGIIAVLLF